MPSKDHQPSAGASGGGRDRGATTRPVVWDSPVPSCHGPSALHPAAPCPRDGATTGPGAAPPQPDIWTAALEWALVEGEDGAVGAALSPARPGPMVPQALTAVEGSKLGASPRARVPVRTSVRPGAASPTAEPAPAPQPAPAPPCLACAHPGRGRGHGGGPVGAHGPAALEGTSREPQAAAAPIRDRISQVGATNTAVEHPDPPLPRARPVLPAAGGGVALGWMGGLIPRLPVGPGVWPGARPIPTGTAFPEAMTVMQIDHGLSALRTGVRGGGTPCTPRTPAGIVPGSNSLDQWQGVMSGGGGGVGPPGHGTPRDSGFGNPHQLTLAVGGPPEAAPLEAGVGPLALPHLSALPPVQAAVDSLLHALHRAAPISSRGTARAGPPTVAVRSGSSGELQAGAADSLAINSTAPTVR